MGPSSSPPCDSRQSSLCCGESAHTCTAWWTSSLRPLTATARTAGDRGRQVPEYLCSSYSRKELCKVTGLWRVKGEDQEMTHFCKSQSFFFFLVFPAFLTIKRSSYFWLVEAAPASSVFKPQPRALLFQTVLISALLPHS